VEWTILIHFKHGILLRIILCDRFVDSRTCGLTCLLRCHQNARPTFTASKMNLYLEKKLSDFSWVHRLSDLRTHMSSWVSSKCMPNFRCLYNEPYLEKIYVVFLGFMDSWTCGLTCLLRCHQNALPTSVASIMNHT
jgi:hypothetical protein